MSRRPIAVQVSIIIFGLVVSVTSAWAAHEKVLHNFDSGDGASPFGTLLFDASGNLYSTTLGGGIHDFGTAFELVPAEGGGWTETVLHSFGRGNDGFLAWGSLIPDSAGNLYGTTIFGGIHTSCAEAYDTCGTVFELSPREGGGWTETVLHNFNSNRSDGFYPYGALVMDGAGNLYGTTTQGGIHECNCGTVFELSPRVGGGWTEKVLHSFNIRDGSLPFGNLIFDAAGNLYGTTNAGGIHGYGTLFELSPREGGGWTETVLHSFGAGNDGTFPNAGLIFDASGNLYGTTYSGGIHGWGTAFEFSPNQDGGWTEKVLYNFNNNGREASAPESNLIFDALGNLYGTSYAGGINPCFETGCGTVYELSPRQDGGWTQTVLHNFGNSGDGIYPETGLIFDAAGNLYGTTSEGGMHGAGTVFEITF
jgi:uncharacterized repeat protein (TIGR03803 family)